MGVVRRCKSLVDIFPPLSVGFGAGVAIGCGVGWPIKQMVGPPKAFCGPGIGLGVGVGYGQGPLGKRFSEDTRNEESLQRIETFEKSVDALVDNLINKAKGITGWKSYLFLYKINKSVK